MQWRQIGQIYNDADPVCLRGHDAVLLDLTEEIIIIMRTPHSSWFQ